MDNPNFDQERREVSGFSRLEFKGIGKVELTQGDHEELVIEAPQEVRERVHADVRGDTLVIYYESDWKDWTGVRLLGGEKIIFRLMMREIKSLALSGVGSLDAARIDGDALSVSLSGPGSTTVGTLNVKSLDLALSGVGSMDVAGSAPDLNVVISGAGTVKAARLEVERAVVKLSGVGTATIWAKLSLDTTISGAGVVEYYGSPAITQRNSGLGVLKYLGNR
ncbi:MAG TPA: head GIN domain-containing protein [Anaerolineaceae bacterium]|nr:head GIN domain-containing protein [Anaerolineaceae bacterium]